MRVINVVVVNGCSVSMDSFGVHEEQLSQEVVDQAENLFKTKVLELSSQPNEEEFDETDGTECGTIEDCVENGHYENSDGVTINTVDLIWTDI